MNDKNEKLKKTLRHYIDLDFYANSVDSELMELYEELGINCEELIASQKSYGTKDAYNLIRKAIKDGVESFGDELEERLETEADNIKQKELDFLSTLYEASLAIGAIETSRILFAPIDNRDTVKQFVERTEKNILRSYENALRGGYLFGQSSDDINEQAKRNLKQVSRGMENGIKSAIPSFAKTTDRIVFLKNEKEVVWCSILDGNECIVCGMLHGTRYPSISMAPGLQHFGCRCFLQPAENITEPMPTYEEYLESLSDEEQYHILGANRYDLWKHYGIELKKFINNGRKLRLDEIDLPANLIVTKTGARSKIVNILSGDDVIKNIKISEDYYNKIRTSNNKDFITRIAENSGKTYSEIEQIVNHVFKEKHNFENGRIAYFDASEEIVKAFERLRTNEHTDNDILLLNHELAELTYMKNKKYNIYEVAHKMANKKYNWQEVIDNANLSQD